MALTQDQIKNQLENVPQWEVSNEKFISRSFKFKQYMDGVQFAYDIGRTAEEMDHHPSIQIEYGEVVVAVTSHDAGGLTERDFKLAQKIDDTFEKMK
ncbi:4a-hydroxytetrahydrobiopterin dehydratase [Pontibacillus marinus]|uniref:Putative pterin-4-alpha-carbinolamine dehydratase n=1 Tax=Pontibacillus marinus BH030004 = DSM 16465 TaxID=1385511 RepID=A0A0A5GC82_9BACI|nr:4a-hydroxytetrahydrobiopterin dehydratase [Pontibacillus marinus]KGX90796.1 pterin-4-alpha-carbinolamine dehydratase [Pontibacillus marinus BH030004 = DSM 16465]